MVVGCQVVQLFMGQTQFECDQLTGQHLNVGGNRSSFTFSFLTILICLRPIFCPLYDPISTWIWSIDRAEFYFFFKDNSRWRENTCGIIIMIRCHHALISMTINGALVTINNLPLAKSGSRKSGQQFSIWRIVLLWSTGRK